MGLFITAAMLYILIELAITYMLPESWQRYNKKISGIFLMLLYGYGVILVQQLYDFSWLQKEMVSFYFILIPWGWHLLSRNGILTSRFLPFSWILLLPCLFVLGSSILYGETDGPDMHRYGQVLLLLAFPYMAFLAFVGKDDSSRL